MGMHRVRPPTRKNPLKDPIERAIAESFSKQIVTLRVVRTLSRHEVIRSEAINHWRRLRQLEDGHRVPCLDEVVKLAQLYGVSYIKLINDTMHDEVVEDACKQFRPPNARDQKFWEKVMASG